MSDTRSVSSEVVVAVDPAIAFVAFTDEMNMWWGRSPISFHDAARAIARRLEPGIGGRLLEVYDDATGDALELGRVTAWEPGRRLAWNSSIDDVVIEVSFDAVPDGTRVRVDASIPPDGADRGGTSYVRVTPAWYGAWCARRDPALTEPQDLARLALAVHYVKPVTAARWLIDAFGFEMDGTLPDQGEDAAWIEFHVGNCALMVFGLTDGTVEHAPITHVPWIFVDDLDEHFARAEAHGASIVEGIHQHGYRGYIARDLEGHHWTFAQARPTMRV
jgi:uncharacterized glyoxalase superfamily protein PhnB